MYSICLHLLYLECNFLQEKHPVWLVFHGARSPGHGKCSLKICCINDDWFNRHCTDLFFLFTVPSTIGLMFSGFCCLICAFFKGLSCFLFFVLRFLAILILINNPVHGVTLSMEWREKVICFSFSESTQDFIRPELWLLAKSHGGYLLLQLSMRFLSAQSRQLYWSE